MNVENNKPSFSDSKIIERANLLRNNDLYPFFRSIEESEGSRVTLNGKTQIMIGSNNYLGLTHHPHVKEAAIKAIEKLGTYRDWETDRKSTRLNSSH